MDGLPNLDNGTANEFAKALFIAELFAERYACNKDNLMTQDLDLEDLA